MGYKSWLLKPIKPQEDYYSIIGKIKVRSLYGTEYWTSKTARITLRNSMTPEERLDYFLPNIEFVLYDNILTKEFSKRKPFVYLNYDTMKQAIREEINILEPYYQKFRKYYLDFYNLKSECRLVTDLDFETRSHFWINWYNNAHTNTYTHFSEFYYIFKDTPIDRELTDMEKIGYKMMLREYWYNERLYLQYKTPEKYNITYDTFLKICPNYKKIIKTPCDKMNDLYIRLHKFLSYKYPEMIHKINKASKPHSLDKVYVHPDVKRLERLEAKNRKKKEKLEEVYKSLEFDLDKIFINLV